MAQVLVVGSVNTDLTAKVREFPLPGETLHGSSLSYSPGGKGNNQATAARRAGSNVIMAGRIGRDALAKPLLDHFAREGIDVSRLLETDLPTGCALIEVRERDAENVIVVIPGANFAVSPRDLDPLGAVFDSSDSVLCQLEIPFETVEKALRMGKERGKLTVLNPAPAAPLPDSIFPLIDYFTPNETEAASLSGLPAESEEDLVRIAGHFLSRGAGNVVITLGVRGSFFMNGRERFFVPAFPVKAVDTTGAGDAFSGALTARLAEGAEIREALSFAAAFSAISVTRPGAASSMPTRKETEDFLRSVSAG